MSTFSRPLVKRQYGSRRSAETLAFSSPNPLRAASFPTEPSSSTASTSSPLRSIENGSSLQNDLGRGARSIAPGASSRKGKGRAPSLEGSSTPPTSSPTRLDRPAMELKTKDETRIARAGARNKGVASASAKSGDLRSFFARTSPRKKRKIEEIASDAEGATDGPGPARADVQASSAPASSSSALKSLPSARPKRSKPIKLEQLYLDPFDTPGRATLSCATCSLSYARTPDDIAFHARHHKKVVSGVDWTVSNECKGITVVRDEIESDDLAHKGVVLMVDWAGADASLKRRLNDVLETIDTELSSTNLTAAQLARSKVFLFVSSQRKVVACAVVERISEAYRVVPSSSSSNARGSSTNDEAGFDRKDSMLRFGEEDDGAIFCSPTAVPTLLGVHRIWTSTSSRRRGLASVLLDSMAERYIYGCPVSTERRREDVAFSQPTGKGKELARRWTGTEAFKVFVD